jgi:hypothetical protein
MRSNAYKIESIRHMERHILRYDDTSVVSVANIALRRKRLITRGAPRPFPRVCGGRERDSIDCQITRGNGARLRAFSFSTFDSFVAARYERPK